MKNQLTLGALVFFLLLMFGCSAVEDMEADMDMMYLDPNKELYDMVDQMPTFVGGEQARMKFLNENITYPLSAIQLGGQGRITLRFVVDTIGNITDVVVNESFTSVTFDKEGLIYVGDANKLEERKRQIAQELKDEALRVTKMMPRWIPGEQEGEKKMVYFNKSIRFRLRQDKPLKERKKTMFDHLSANLQYPQSIANLKASGALRIRFVEHEDGRISNVEYNKRMAIIKYDNAEQKIEEEQMGNDPIVKALLREVRQVAADAPKDDLTEKTIHFCEVAF